jgi:hypothetical protein
VGLLFEAQSTATVGGEYFRDHSRETRLTIPKVTIIGTIIRSRGRFFPLNATIVPRAVRQLQRVSISNVQNAAMFIEDDELVDWLRILGSFRLDRVDVETVPTLGYVAVVPRRSPPRDPTAFPSVSGVIQAVA